jgi:hypothetical protein
VAHLADETKAADVKTDQSKNGRRSIRDWLRLRRAPVDDDTYVTRWKQTWAGGAEARWRGRAGTDNPHPPDSAFATAWSAGWRWADQQPDRRKPSSVRFAVPQRRAADRVSPLRRSARAGAVGLSVVAVAGWLWQTQRRGR